MCRQHNKLDTEVRRYFCVHKTLQDQDVNSNSCCGLQCPIFIILLNGKLKKDISKINYSEYLKEYLQILFGT